MAPRYTVPKPRACHNCAVAKAKCEPAIGWTKCKRCTRQDVDCFTHAVEPRKRRQVLPAMGDTAIHAVPVVANGAASCRLFEIERGLGYYRSCLFPFFPFVVMPDVRLPAASFASEKPCLALVVAMLGCTKDRARQGELAAHARAYLGSHMVQAGQKSLDLLQGLMVLVHW